MWTRRLATMRAARDRATAPDPAVRSPSPGSAGARWARSRATVLLGALTAVCALVLGAVVTVDLFGASAWAQSRSERIGDVRIDAELAEDGALRVVEQREFVYDGSFEGAFYELPLTDGQQVTLNGLTDAGGTTYQPGPCSAEEGATRQPGAYQLEQDGGRFAVTWCWDPPPTDTSRTITLDYTVEGAGQRHEDSSELFWQLIGAGWDVPTASAVATVDLPVDADDDLQFWARGPLTGTIEQTEPGTLRLAVDDLPPNTGFEVRALMPAAALSAAPSDGREVREDILAEERCLAIQANAERARARGEVPTEDCDPQAAQKRWLTGALAVGLLAGGAGWWQMFRRHGREHPLPEGLADYERDLPSDHPPAVVDYLLNWGDVSDKALTATILDLARRRHLRVTRELVTQDRGLLPDREQAITVFERGPAPERGFERDVHDLLFDRVGRGADRITDRDLKDWVSSHREEAYRWWTAWTSDVARSTTGQRWMEDRAVWIALSVVIGVALLGAAIGAALLGANIWLAIVTGLVGVGAMAASPLMRRRTHDGRVLEHRWRRFGAYLTDYSLIPERGPEYLILWGTYLVYAVPLGVAETVVKNLNAKLSEAELQQVAGGWYPVLWINGHMYGGFDSGLSAVSMAIPTAEIASSPASSGAGAGGGFSGGFGGGGGGSGGGSF